MTFPVAKSSQFPPQVMHAPYSTAQWEDTYTFKKIDTETISIDTQRTMVISYNAKHPEHAGIWSVTIGR